MLSILRALSGRVAAVIAECNYAQRRLSVLRASPDRYLAQPELAPDTYQEFLFRTSGPLAHEPSAAQRSVDGRLKSIIFCSCARAASIGSTFLAFSEWRRVGVNYER